MSRLGSLQCAIHNGAQVGNEGFVVCDVVVCPRLERRGRGTHFLWRDDDYWCGQSAAANVMDEGRAALILYLRFYHQCVEIRVLLDPALRGGEASSPRESDVRRDIAKGYRGELRGAAFVRYIEDFHAANWQRGCRWLLSVTMCLRGANCGPPACRDSQQANRSIGRPRKVETVRGYAYTEVTSDWHLPEETDCWRGPNRRGEVWTILSVQ